MRKSRIKHIFSTLSKKEIRDLRKWLHSPAHNQREDTVRLFEYLVADDRLETEIGLDKASVFSYVFQEEETYQDAKMRQTMYFLLKVTENFLAYEAFCENVVVKNITLAQALRKKKLDTSFEKAIANAETANRKQPFRSIDYLNNEHTILLEQYSYQSRKGRSVPMNLQELSDSLNNSFLVERLHQACLMLSHQRVYKTEYDYSFLTTILATIDEQKLIKDEVFGIYYYLYRAISEYDKEIYFYEMKKRLLQYAELFPQEEIGDIYLLAINYCIRKMNGGQEIFIREAFELYKNGFEKRILIQSGQITHWTFINVVLIALRIQEFDWVAYFIDHYQKNLPIAQRENTAHYCQARLYHSRGDYDKAMKLFTQVEYKDILMNLNAKAILMKIYYELDEQNPLESLLGSMRTYLHRKKVVGYHKTNYQNIIRYVKKLTRVNPYDKAEIQKLRTEIEGISPLTEKKWLLEQLQKLRN